MQAMGVLKPIDFLVVVHDAESKNIEEEQWLGFGAGIKGCIKV